MRAYFWWIPVGMVVAYTAKKVIDNKRNKERMTVSSLLINSISLMSVSPLLTYNLDRLRCELSSNTQHKVAMLGQPGAGKSTLLDLLTDESLEPRPKIGTTTDATDWSQDKTASLYAEYKGCIYVDVPGHGTATHPVDVITNQFPLDLFDQILFVVRGKVMDADIRVWERLRLVHQTERILVVRSFAETLSAVDTEKVLYDIAMHLPGANTVLASNRTGQGLAEIKSFLNKSTTLHR